MLKWLISMTVVGLHADGSKAYVLDLMDADLGIEKYYHIILK